MNKIINGKAIAEKIKEELKVKLKTMTKIPTLAVIQVGNDESSNSYIKAKRKVAEEIGINFLHFKYEEASNEEIITKITELNADGTVHGILIQLPLPKNLNEDLIINNIDPKKDVDGLTNINLGKLMSDQEGMTPCTPTGIMELLTAYRVNLEGKHAVIIGRSRLVGKPLLHLLLNQNATVTICHSKTKNLKDITSQADILIVAVGKPRFVTRDMVKENSIIIDVGINRENNILVGDVDFDQVINKVTLITPVPKGVGPMTVIELMKNTIKAIE